jgi:hypothetical protein
MIRALPLALLALAGCSTDLTDAGSRVRVVTDRQGCTFLRLVTTKATLGPDKPGSALKAALNETAAAGGNGLFIITNSTHWADGASVAGEALRCPSS